MKLFPKSFGRRRLFEKRRHPETFIFPTACFRDGRIMHGGDSNRHDRHGYDHGSQRVRHGYRGYAAGG
ncbi:hypothetical protein F1542_03515 [Komagataeibacter sp. FXV3]|nr:hypothetical protein [Komagataeibacter sp. FXV3]